MHRRDGKLILAATDLVGFLACGHLTNLERQADAGLIRKPSQREDPEVLLLQRRGGEHEKRYVTALETRGRTVVHGDQDWDHSYEARAAETERLMRAGAGVIYQATVFDGRWVGFPDFLLRVGDPGVLGTDHHYEVADTKLAHTAKASALIQMASYVEQIDRIQGVRPEKIYVVTGGAEIQEHQFRTAEMMAYYRHAKQRFENALATELNSKATYPDPVEHCNVCKWYRDYCWRQYREDDALPLVAGISRAQRQTLKTHHVNSRAALAVLEKSFDLGLKRSQDESMWRVREQARLQLQSEEQGTTLYELLEPEKDADGGLVADRGLSALPKPSVGDLFFDIEGDPFAFWEGLEYLFGVWDGTEYRAFWALSRDEEKPAFERTMDLFMERWREHPDMHIYHYAPYEPTALKRLAGRHATRADELDQLLRGRVFVDLYRAVRQGVRVGAESYSIKKLEDLYGYKREIELRDANASIVEFETVLEVGDPSGEIRDLIAGYNRDDCVSTERLRDWLEAGRREAATQFGVDLPRPSAAVEEPSEEFTDRQRAVRELEERLTAAIPKDPTEQTGADTATWLLRHLLDWHRRENKSAWWRFYELMGMSEDELVEQAEPIGQLEFVERIVREGKRITTDDWRYRFPAQEHKVEVEVDVHDPEITEGETKTGKVTALDDDARTVDIRRSKTWDGRHPQSIVPLNIFRVPDQQDALMRIGQWVAENGIESDSPDWRAARDLLLRLPPRAGQKPGAPLAAGGESGGEAALRLSGELDGTTLAIQGPPGSGKTWTGARMILELIRAGKKVGIASNSHKAIANFIRAVLDAGDARVIQRANDEADCYLHGSVKRGASNQAVADGLAAGEFDVAAGTSWLWADEDLAGAVDTLFVDEASQVSLANVIAMSGCARNIVLLGDPQQLEQPLQGVHPGGAGRSALGHFLGDRETVEPERGIFFEKTWRLHPGICSFTSQLFYEGRLEPVPGLEQQRVLPDGLAEEFAWLAGSGLRWIPVEHDGNTNASPEEASRVFEIWHALVGQSWMDRRGARRIIGPDDILIVSPFNAHRLLIQSLLPAARVGTVDKFQGQEAPISIFTMATSRPEDAPRGIAFLYALNRLNVATSRARALAIVVASPRLTELVPGPPTQLAMVNALSVCAEHSIDYRRGQSLRSSWPKQTGPRAPIP